jgi:hypothetical protein
VGVNSTQDFRIKRASRVKKLQKIVRNLQKLQEIAKNEQKLHRFDPILSSD